MPENAPSHILLICIFVKFSSASDASPANTLDQMLFNGLSPMPIEFKLGNQANDQFSSVVIRFQPRPNDCKLSNQENTQVGIVVS